MGSLIHRIGAWRLGVSGGVAVLLALAVALAVPGSGAKTAEAGDLASMVALMQSMRPESLAPGGPAAAGAGAASATAAAADYYLKIDGIPGESTDDRHAGEIEVLSFSWGVSTAGSAASRGGAGAGKVEMQDFNLVIPASIASPRLFIAAATGQHIKSAVLTLRKAGGESHEYMRITLTDVLVSSYQSSGSSGDMPTESISLNFAKVEFEYVPQNADGTAGAPVKAGYDVKLNKKI